MQVSGNPNNIYMYVTQALPTHSKTFSSSQGGNEMEWNGVGIETLSDRPTPIVCQQEIPTGITWTQSFSSFVPLCLLCFQYNRTFSLWLRLKENNDYILNFRILPEHIAK